MSSLALALGSLCLIIVVEQMRRVNNSDLAVASWNVFCAQSGTGKVDMRTELSAFSAWSLPDAFFEPLYPANTGLQQAKGITPVSQRTPSTDNSNSSLHQHHNSRAAFNL